jgi:hypothetical protein
MEPVNSVYIKKVLSTLKNQTQRECWEDLGADVRIILKRISEKQGAMLWSDHVSQD